MQNKDIEKQIKSIIKYSSSAQISVKLLLIIISTFVVVRFAPKFSLVIPFLIFGIMKLDLEFNPTQLKFRKKLKQALEAYKNNDLIQLIRLLNEAYLIIPNKTLSQLIRQVSRDYDLQEYADIEFVSKEKEKVSDPTARQILDEMLKVLNYLIEHKIQLHNLKAKKAQLEEEMRKAPSQYTADVKRLIERYENIIKLEQSKIELYKKLKGELKDVYNNYIYSNKLMKEYRFIEELEDRYLSSSVKDSLDADDKKDFIQYHSTYLETLAEYADQINTTNNQDLFEEIREEFENKKQNLSG